MNNLNIVVIDENQQPTEFRLSRLESSGLTSFLKERLGKKKAIVELKANKFSEINPIEDALVKLGLTYKLIPSEEVELIVKLN